MAEEEAAFGAVFFEGEPEDGALDGGHPGEWGAGGDAQGQVGGEAGFALLGSSGEDDEVALWDPVLDEPAGWEFGLELPDGLEEVVAVAEEFFGVGGAGYRVVKVVVGFFLHTTSRWQKRVKTTTRSAI